MSFVVTTGVVRQDDTFAVNGLVRRNFKLFAASKAFQDKSSVTPSAVAVCGPDGVLAIHDPISVQIVTNKGEQGGIAFAGRPCGGRGAELGDVPITMVVGLLQRVIGRVGYSKPHAALPAFKLEEAATLPSVVPFRQFSKDDERGCFASISSRFEPVTCMGSKIEGAALSAAPKGLLAHLEPPNRGSTACANQSKAESRERAPLNPANLKVAYTPLRISNTRSTSPDHIFPNKHLGEVNHNRTEFFK